MNVWIIVQLDLFELLSGNVGNLDGKLLEGGVKSKSGKFNGTMCLQLIFGFVGFLDLLDNDGSSGGASTLGFVGGMVGIVTAMFVLILPIDDC